MEKLTGMTEREMIMINFLTRRSIERIIVVDRMRVHVDEDLDNEDVRPCKSVTLYKLGRHAN